MLTNKIKILFTTLILPIICTFTAFSQTVDHWETIIKTGDYCRYKIPKSNIGTGWIAKDFNDSSWEKTKSGIGFGDDDDNTKISKGTNSVYIRHSFTIESKAEIASLILDIDYDDGFIAYLNGTEVARDNVENPATWNMKLNGTHEAALYQGNRPERFSISRYITDFLKDGKNVLAVEVHNQSSSSSDLSSNVFLHVGITSSKSVYGSTPDWFWTPVDYSNFNLPLMIINTNGQTIPDEPRIVADMGLINNGEGKTNSELDDWNEYSGKISIEQRGESSIGFRKKSYSIELQNEDGSNNNVSILGLPEENDFVLYGPYSDKTLMKNVLSYELFRRTGRWAPRTRYIEIILNGEYRGVYVLTEKLKRDENRVDIDKLTKKDVTPQEISGGYILRHDKVGKLDPDDYWTSPVGQPYHERMWYEYYDPEYKKLTEDQANYIKDWMKNFDEVLSGRSFNDENAGYRKYIRTKSFVDMMFLNEISKGIDNYLFSAYFYKENDADGGQLNAGPPWDYNLGYGNVDYGQDWDAAETYGWCYTQGSRMYWFERLMEDEAYRNLVYCRWTEFRETIYSDDNIESIIDSCVTVLGDAVDRNYDKYPILGEYFWPSLYYPDTYEEEIEILKDWLFERLQWIDNKWYNMGHCADTGTKIDAFAETLTVKVYPNPSDFSNLNFELQPVTTVEKLSVNIYDLQGRLLEQEIKSDVNNGKVIFQFSNLSHFNPGIYIYKIVGNNGIISVGKLSKY